MQILIICVLVVTLLAIYGPIIYIRKTNKLQKVLEAGRLAPSDRRNCPCQA